MPPRSVWPWRTVFAVVMLAPFAIGRIGAEVREFDARDVRLIIASGVLLAMHFIFWIESLYYTSVASASVLVATSPVFLAVLGFFLLGERLTGRTVLAIVAAVAGSVLIGLGDSGSAAPVQGNMLRGNMLAATAALFVSGYLLIGRVVRRRTSWITYVFCIYSVVAVIVVGIALASGVQLFGLSTYTYVMCGLMALGPQIAGHGSFNYAVKYIPAAMLGLLSLTEPVGGSLVAFILFEEVPSVLAVAGMTIVLLSVGVALRKPRSGFLRRAKQG
ncbi:MAG: DMT family transporter [Rhodothermales bacterium]|nr:DMT family transporter [Rhodothermales bacterium]